VALVLSQSLSRWIRPTETTRVNKRKEFSPASTKADQEKFKQGDMQVDGEPEGEIGATHEIAAVAQPASRDAFQVEGS
jgi:hypothetical protein